MCEPFTSSVWTGQVNVALGSAQFKFSLRSLCVLCVSAVLVVLEEVLPQRHRYSRTGRSLSHVSC